MKVLFKKIFAFSALALLNGLIIGVLSSCESFKVWVLDRNGIYNDISYKTYYASDEDCPDGNIEDIYLTKYPTFEEGKIYYFVMDFTYISYSEKDDWEDINIQLSISSPTDVAATLQEASTGKYSEVVGEDETTINVTYSMPEKFNDEKEFRIIVRLEMLTGNPPVIGYSVTGKNSNVTEIRE